MSHPPYRPNFMSLNMPPTPLAPQPTYPPDRKPPPGVIITNPHNNPQSPITISEERQTYPPKKKLKTAPSSQAPDIVDIIADGPPGDIVIQVKLPTNAPEDPADTKYKLSLIRTHALLLTIASRYFQRVLSELNPLGAPQIYTASNPLILPEDFDGPAFLDWVIMVCGQTEQLEVHAAKTTPSRPGSPSVQKQSWFARLPRVVALSGRLECTRNMKAHCSMPLWRFFGPQGETDEDGLSERGLTVIDAIAIAFVVGDQTLFSRATEYALVNLSDAALEQDIPPALAGDKVNDLIDRIKALRLAHLETLESATYAPITAIRTKLLPRADGDDALIDPCRQAEEKLAAYTLQMCNVKEGHFSFAETTSSLADVWDRLETMVENLPEEKGNGRKCGKGCEGGACAVDVRQGVLDAVEAGREAVGGLCLGCEREGREGECPHGD